MSIWDPCIFCTTEIWPLFCIQVDFEGVKLGLLSGLKGRGFHWLLIYVACGNLTKSPFLESAVLIKSGMLKHPSDTCRFE